MAQLRRELKLLETVALGVGMMLGVGIFFGPTLTAQEIADERVVLLLWLLGGVTTAAGAWLFGRLGARYPLAGGPYVYLREAWGPFPAFLFAWTGFVLVAPAALATLSSIFALMISQVAPLTPRGVLLLTLWALAATTFANVLGVKLGARAQTVLVGLKVLLVVALVATLTLAASYEPVDDASAGGNLAVAFVGVLFAFTGWEYVLLVSEEVKDSARTLSRGMLIAAMIVTILYLAATAAFLRALGTGGVTASLAIAPDAAARAGVPFLPVIIAGGIALSALGTVNAIMLLAPRGAFAVARDGLAPARLAYLSSRWRTPVYAIGAQLALAIAILAMGKFEGIVTAMVVGSALFVSMTAFAGLRLLRDGSRAERWIACFVGTAYGAVVGLLIVGEPTATLPALAAVAAGVVPYAFMRKRYLPSGGLAEREVKEGA